MSKLTVAVTGVASGIGAALARSLKEQGHDVIGFDIRETHENVDRFISLDLNSPDSIHAAVASADTPLDGVCNNAGLPPRAGLETAILQVNFLGTRAFTTVLLPHLRQGGSIVNMASRAGYGWREGAEQVKRLARLTQVEQLTPFVASEQIDATRCYNLSKGAVILWTVAESEAMTARGLRVNSLSPGGIATRHPRGLPDGVRSKDGQDCRTCGPPGQSRRSRSDRRFFTVPCVQLDQGHGYCH